MKLFSFNPYRKSHVLTVCVLSKKHYALVAEVNFLYNLLDHSIMRSLGAESSGLAVVIIWYFSIIMSPIDPEMASRSLPDWAHFRYQIFYQLSGESTFTIPAGKWLTNYENYTSFTSDQSQWLVSFDRIKVLSQNTSRSL